MLQTPNPVLPVDPVYLNQDRLANFVLHRQLSMLHVAEVLRRQSPRKDPKFRHNQSLMLTARR
jgi:hypothetical protein